MLRLALALTLVSTPALAQDYHAPSQTLWVQMVQAIQNVPMSAMAHQQVGQILISVQQQAKEASNAKQVPQAGPNDGGGGAQPEVRKEGGNPAEGGQGVQQGRPSQAKGK